MYFWNINRLKNDLTHGLLKESDSFTYLISYIIFIGITSVTSTLTDYSSHLYYTLVGLLICICGTTYVYFRNGGAKGKNFLSRYISIQWVVGWRWCVFITLPYCLVFFILAAVQLISLDSPFIRIGGIIIVALSYWRIGKHIHDVATTKDTNENFETAH